MRYGELRVWIDAWDGVAVVGAEGEIDLGTVDALRSATMEVVRDRPHSMVFDLRKVSFIDSSGLGVLLAARKQLGGAVDAVVILTNQPAVLNSLVLTGLDRLLKVQTERAELTAAG